MTTPSPPSPFDPAVEKLDAGSLMFRIHNVDRGPTEFNPGFGSRTRFAFFDDENGEVVPVLYAGQSDDIAAAETLLHDIPLTGGTLTHDDYSSRVMSRLMVTRELKLANLRGLGLRRFSVSPEQLTATDADAYPETVAWAEAAHRAGFDGLTWTSRQCNDGAAYVFFGDRCGDAFAADPTFARMFETAPGLAWLIDLCAPLRIDVLPQP